MSENRKYFWLKLQKAFFNDKKVKRLRKIAGGEIYTIIYLKLLLESLENNCTIIIDGICEDPMEELELSIDESKDNIKACLLILEKMQLCQFSNNILTFNDIERFIGSGSTEADRVKKYRDKQKLLQEKNIKEKEESTESETNRTESVTKVYECTQNVQKSYLDIDKDIELNKELDGYREVDLLLNHTHFKNFDDFEKLYLFWYIKLTGQPVSSLEQTVSAKRESINKLEWLKINFKNRKVHAGVAIFETLEFIAQDKSCQNNFKFRASNYLDGVISRLVDINLAATDPVSNEGKSSYQNPTFDYFKY